MSPISFTQQGIVTQYEFAKILIVTSDGVIEVSLPLTDDERRDMEIHLRGKFSGCIAFQVKSTTHLVHRFKAYQMSLFFSVPKGKLISHPNFWYFVAYFDMKAIAFANPVFIVPSIEMHKHAAPHFDGERWTFNFGASLDPESHDHWRPYQAQTHKVGARVLEILEQQKAARTMPPLSAEVGALDGLVLVGHSTGKEAR
jgi:hypothetical protein